MTWKNVSRMEALESGVQSRTRIRQCHAEDCQVHALVRRQLHRCSAGVYVDALAVHLDQKRKRFSADPVGRALRWTSTALFMSIKRHLAKKTIVGRRQHANFPWTDSPHVPGFYCVAG